MIEPAALATGRRNPPIPGLSRQRGLTLIEIMVTLVLLSILVLGLSGLWANVNKDFLFMTVKQKAIFVLNGEMSRLSALYRFTDFGSADTESVTYTAAPTARTIYIKTGAAVTVVDDIVTQTGSDFDCGTSTSASVTNCADRVLYDDGSTTTGSRIYVWLDQKRKITGQLSWVATDATGSSISALCANGNEVAADGVTAQTGTAITCKELTVYLAFPFRYNSATDPGADPGFGKTETLSLMTIVGRRP